MRVIAGIGGAAVAVLTGLWLFQRRLIYLASSEVPDPGLLPPQAEEIHFETEDGLRLPGWFLPPEPPEKAVTVLFLPGNAGHRAGRLPFATGLARVGVGVLLFDYRGYAGNPGRPSEDGLMADARAARAWLESRDDVDADGIVYFGESLGAAVAVGLATQHPPAALILRSPFTSLVDVARVHYRPLPVRHLLWDRFPSLDRITHVGAPVLVMLGKADEIVPAEMSRRLYDAAPEPKRLVEIPGAGHEVLDPRDEARLMGETIAFVTEYVAARGGPG